MGFLVAVGVLVAVDIVVAEGVLELVGVLAAGHVSVVVVGMIIWV